MLQICEEFYKKLKNTTSRQIQKNIKAAYDYLAPRYVGVVTMREKREKASVPSNQLDDRPSTSAAASRSLQREAPSNVLTHEDYNVLSHGQTGSEFLIIL